MKIEKIDINKLKPAAYNPRQINTKQYKDLKQSIEKFGLVDPIIINENGYVVIGGHQRLKICKELKHKEVGCVILNLNTEQERELNIRLNKNTGEFDFDLLANEFEIEELTDWGFKHIDLGLNIDKITEGNTEDDHIPEVKESRVKLGDVWQLGKHRLMCGDSTKESDVNKLMNGEKADMVFTDPPYNVDYDGGSKKREKIKNDKLNDFSQFLNSCFSNMHKFMKDGSCIYITHSEVERLSFTENFKMVGFQLSSIIIWVKNNSTFSMNKDYKWKHEPIIYGWKKGSHNFYGDNTQDTVWLYDRPSKSKLHPTTKPIELINKAIKNSSKTKDIVLDIFLGSGSTLIACEKTNRICYGMELDTKYCDVIIERWEQFTGQKAKKL
jgi:DNA modification methylase